MKVYELMSLLSEADAGDDITVNICLSKSELMSGDEIENDVYALSLNIDEFDVYNGCISTTL